MPARLTGSGLDRAAHCPPAFALPGVRHDSADAARGRGVHAYLEQLVAGAPRDEALATVTDPAVRSICEGIDPDQVCAGEAEVSYAYNVRTGRARRTDTPGRMYETGDDEIPGTMDRVHREPSGRPVVTDWKNTSYSVDIEAARPQVEFYALCAARECGHPSAGCAVGVITEDGAIAWERWHLDEDALLLVAARVRRTWDKVQQARAEKLEYERSTGLVWVPDVARGAWCRYCPAQVYCPAVRAAVSLGAAMPEQITPEAAAEGFLRAQTLALAEKELRAAVGLFHDDNGPIPLPDGRVIGRTRGTGGRPGSLRVLGRRAA